MKQLHFIVEGQTEVEFVKNLLFPYLNERGIYGVRVSKITKKGGKGGFVNYQHLKNDVQKILKSEQQVIVTSFVDFFRLPTNVPAYAEAQKLLFTSQKIDLLEQRMQEDIGDERFIAYIQQHEFEALLFSSDAGFREYFADRKIEPFIQAILQDCPNPEDINDKPETAPSKRIMSFLPDYDKVTFGSILAMEIGLETILEKCPRFRSWVGKVLDSMKEK